MKRLTGFLALCPAAAFAQAGDHSHVGFQGNLMHLLTEPDHLAMMVLALAAVGLALYLGKWRQP